MDRPTWLDPYLRLELATLVDLSILGFKVGCRPFLSQPVMFDYHDELNRKVDKRFNGGEVVYPRTSRVHLVSPSIVNSSRCRGDAGGRLAE